MANSDLDKDGQPTSSRFNQVRRSGRDVDELIGLCRGVAADGRVNQAEAEFLCEWLGLSDSARDEWPGDILYHRAQHMLRDGVLDRSEEGELLELLRRASGGDPRSLNASSLTAGLPLTTPAPDLDFRGKQFCFTGKFLLGPRATCEKAVTERGGTVQEAITKDLDFLVIGIVGSRDWIHSSFGRKIERAVALQRSGAAIAIVSEQRFASALR